MRDQGSHNNGMHKTLTVLDALLKSTNNREVCAKFARVLTQGHGETREGKDIVLHRLNQ